MIRAGLAAWDRAKLRADAQRSPAARTLAVAAAALAGYVDAVGFLSADRYFVLFMSGNTTRLGWT